MKVDEINQLILGKARAIERAKLLRIERMIRDLRGAVLTQIMVADKAGCVESGDILRRYMLRLRDALTVVEQMLGEPSPWPRA